MTIISQACALTLSTSMILAVSATAIAADPSAPTQGSQKSASSSPAAHQGNTQPGQARTGQAQAGQMQKGQAQAGAQQPGHAAANTITFERATQLSRSALESIKEARTALARKDDTTASKQLDAALTNLRTLYDAVPQGKLLKDLGTGNSVDLAPVMADMEEASVYVDPEVAAQVKRASQKQKKGDTAGADTDLRLARQTLAADVAVLPVEDAYSRVAAARSELKEGNRDRAATLLQNVPVIVERVTVSAPLVPVRFDLRAAAEAAQAGNWNRANELVGRATSGLESVASMPGNADLKKHLQPVIDKAKDLDRRVSSGKKPQPHEFLDLAKQTRSAAATL